jgi:hypothetical protein
MKLYVTPLVAVLVLGAFASTIDRPATLLKCANSPVLFPDAPEPVYVLNGKAVDKAVFQGLDPKSVKSLEIMCAPELHQRFGVAARRTGIVVFTAPVPQALLQAGLDEIVQLQATYVRQHGVFGSTLGDLQWRDRSGLITVELTVTSDGNAWSATGRHRYLIGPRSAITVSGAKPRSTSE